MQSSKLLGWLLLGIVAWNPSLGLAQATGDVPPSGPQLTKPPALLQFVEASYPTVEPAPTGDVAVVLDLVIDATGHVTEAAVSTSGGAAFDAAALAAARQFLFSPAEIDHVPAPIRIAYQYVFTLRQEVIAPTTAALSGRVVDEATSQPIAQVKVELQGGPTTETDAAGHFTFAELAPGVVTLTLSGTGFSMLQAQETLVAGEALEVVYEVALAPEEEAEADGDDMEILVRAPPELRREVVSTRVSAQQARSIPGAQGDVLRVVESLPGVGRSAVGSGQLVVWGASPEDTRTLVDGVPIPRLYHEGGLRSTIHSSVVDSVELVPGGWGAAYGRGLGGLVRVDTKTPDRDGTHGVLSLDLYDASASISTDLGRRWRASISGRLSVIDQLAPEIDAKLGEFAPIPRYRDAQLRFTKQTSETSHIDIVSLLSTDRTSRGVPNPDPALVSRERRATDFYRVYARMVTEGSDGTRTIVTPFVGYTTQENASALGSVDTFVARNEWLAGVRASHALRLTAWLNLEAGIDAEITHAETERRGSLSLPAREGDIRVFNQPPPDVASYDKWTSASIGVAPYVEADLAPVDALHIVPGLRIDPMLQSVSRRLPQAGDVPSLGQTRQQFTAEPRLAVRWNVNEHLAWHGATGVYHQPPSPNDLSATFGNPLLPPASGTHYVLGAKLKALEGLSAELTGFATFSDELAMRNPSESPQNAQALAAIGAGRARGVQALVRGELGTKLFGWVTYTLMRAERRNAEDAAWRKLDFDQTHVLTAVAVWAPWKGFELGARVRAATGAPRTRVVGAYYDARRDRYQPIFGPHNQIRIPPFFQLDLRASQTFEIHGTQLQAYLELQNVSNQQNAEELVFSPDFTRASTIKSLPFLPVGGVQWTF